MTAVRVMENVRMPGAVPTMEKIPAMTAVRVMENVQKPGAVPTMKKTPAMTAVQIMERIQKPGAVPIMRTIPVMTAIQTIESVRTPGSSSYGDDFGYDSGTGHGEHTDAENSSDLPGFTTDRWKSPVRLITCLTDGFQKTNQYQERICACAKYSGR